MSERRGILEFNSVTLGYGDFVAVSNVSLTAPSGSFVALLGPSGCGKTTLLRSVAGLVEPVSGEIRINGRSVNDIPVHRRNIGMVFQNYALFPHKTVAANIGFGLKYKGLPKDKIRQRVAEALELVRLPHVAERYPSELSGGQQQRIAIARAIVTEPDVLLLDEPLSALDANLRAEMRAEIRYLQKKTGITTVFVTHDQEEALSLADMVVIMRQGQIVQAGTPEDVYRAPQTRFAAEFLGNANIVPGRVVDVTAARTVTDIAGIRCEIPGALKVTTGQQIQAVIRSNRIGIEPLAANGLSSSAKVAERTFFGDKISYIVEAAGTRLTVVRSSEKAILAEGAAVKVTLDTGDLTLLDDSGNRLALASA